MDQSPLTSSIFEAVKKAMPGHLRRLRTEFARVFAEGDSVRVLLALGFFPDGSGSLVDFMSGRWSAKFQLPAQLLALASRRTDLGPANRVRHCRTLLRCSIGLAGRPTFGLLESNLGQGDQPVLNCRRRATWWATGNPREAPGASANRWHRTGESRDAKLCASAFFRSFELRESLDPARGHPFGRGLPQGAPIDSRGDCRLTLQVR